VGQGWKGRRPELGPSPARGRCRPRPRSRLRPRRGSARRALRGRARGWFGLGPRLRVVGSGRGPQEGRGRALGVRHRAVREPDRLERATRGGRGAYRHLHPRLHRHRRGRRGRPGPADNEPGLRLARHTAGLRPRARRPGGGAGTRLGGPPQPRHHVGPRRDEEVSLELRAGLRRGSATWGHPRRHRYLDHLRGRGPQPGGARLPGARAWHRVPAGHTGRDLHNLYPRLRRHGGRHRRQGARGGGADSRRVRARRGHLYRRARDRGGGEPGARPRPDHRGLEQLGRRPDLHNRPDHRRHPGGGPLRQVRLRGRRAV
ncbi:MAG: hypothetical protein AVDCRST_MAG12-1976, partial [uncultured Rubrobacteraceae bacterium]